MMIYVSKRNFGLDGWHIAGHFEFQNGNTKGRQEFSAESLEELIVKMREFMGGMESK